MARMLKIVAGIFLLVVLSIAVFIATFDINRYKDDLVRIVKDSTGRTLEISGDISFGISLLPTVVIENAKLSNAAWGSAPEMASMESLEIELALLPLLTKEFHINSVRLLESVITLETNQKGLANWEFAIQQVGVKTSKTRKNTFDLAIDEVLIENATVIYKNAETGKQIKLYVEEVSVEADSFDDPVYVFLDLIYDEIPIEVEGVLGSINQLTENKMLPVTLDLDVGNAVLELEGKIAAPMDLAGVDLTVALNAKKLSNLSKLLERDFPEFGPVKMSGKLSGNKNQFSMTSLDLTMGVVGVKNTQLKLKGQIEDVLALKGVEVGVKADLASLAEVSTIVGKELPDLGPVSLAGKITDSNDAYAITAMELQAGVKGAKDANIELKGQIADLKAFKGFDVVIQMQVNQLPDLEILSGRELPALGPVNISGRIADENDVYSFKEIDMQAGVLSAKGAKINLTGQVGDFVNNKGIDLSVNLEVESLADLSTLTGKELPEIGPIKLSGNIVDDENYTYSLQDIDIQAGVLGVSDAKLKLSGSVADLIGVQGGNLKFKLEVNKLSDLSTLTGMDLPPLGPATLSGNIMDINDNYAVKNLILDTGILGVNDARLNVSGDITELIKGKGLNLDIQLEVEKLPELSTLIGQELPELGPVKLSGNVTDTNDLYSIKNLKLQAGVLGVTDANINVAGEVKSLTDGKGLDLAIVLDVNNLADLSKLAGKELPEIGPLKLSGNVSDTNEIYSIRNMELQTGLLGISDAKINASGQVIDLMKAKGIELAINLDINKLSDLSTFSGTDLPELGPVKLSGTITDSNEHYSMSNMEFLAGVLGAKNSQIKASGEISELLAMKGFDLAVDLDVKQLSDLSTLTGSDLPEFGPMKLSGKVKDNNDSYVMQGLTVKSLSSDLSGEVTAKLIGKRPIITAKLTSSLLDWTEMFPDEGVLESEKNKTRVFSSEPLALDALKVVDADVTISAKKIITSDVILENTDVVMKLQNSNLEIKPFNTTMTGASLNGKFSLDARGEAAVIQTNMSVKGIDPSQLIDLQDQVSGVNTDIDFNADGIGNSVSQIMANLNGKLLMNMGEGLVTGSIAKAMEADVLGEVIGLVNPFSKSSEKVNLKCAVVNLDINNGIARTNKGIVISSDRMTITGSGQVNLKTEAVGIAVRSQVHKGLGISVGSFADLVSISGSIANPTISTDLKGTVTTGVSAGTAIATGGLSMLVKGLFDRTTADLDPCATALGQTTSSNLDNRNTRSNNTSSFGSSRN